MKKIYTRQTSFRYAHGARTLPSEHPGRGGSKNQQKLCLSMPKEIFTELLEEIFEQAEVLLERARNRQSGGCPHLLGMYEAAIEEMRTISNEKLHAGSLQCFNVREIMRFDPLGAFDLISLLEEVLQLQMETMENPPDLLPDLYAQMADAAQAIGEKGRAAFNGQDEIDSFFVGCWELKNSSEELDQILRNPLAALMEMGVVPSPKAQNFLMLYASMQNLEIGLRINPQ